MGICYKRCAEQRALNAESARIEAPRGVGFLGGGVPLLSRLGDLGERRELPQRGPGRSPGRQRILGIFQGLRILLVETMHYAEPTKNLGGLCPPNFWLVPHSALFLLEGF